jgi:glycosyltransferase involved in cell wall biosynthesis
MVEAGLRVLSDGDLAARIGAAARQSALERFDVEKIVPRYVQFYERSRSG